MLPSVQYFEVKTKESPSLLYRSLYCAVDKVYGELQLCLDQRVSVEGRAVEAAIAMAKERIEDQSMIEYEWKMQVGYGLDFDNTDPFVDFAVRVASQQCVKSG